MLTIGFRGRLDYSGIFSNYFCMPRSSRFFTNSETALLRLTEKHINRGTKEVANPSPILQHDESLFSNILK